MFIANVTRVQRVSSYQDINLIIDYAWLQIVIMFFQFTNSAREHGYLVFPRRAARCYLIQFKLNYIDRFIL